jgi:hypothetical protein
MLALLIAGVAEVPEQALLAAQRQWIASYNNRDETLLKAIESDDFRITFGDGRVQQKADQLAQLRKAPPKGAKFEIVVESSEVRLYGDAAVICGIVAERGTLVDEQGVTRSFAERSRYTDTWVLRNGRWQVVASHLSDIKPAPPH